MADDRQRDESGQYAKGSTTAAGESDVIDAMSHADDPVVSTGEVVQAVGASRQTVLRRLRSLHESGAIERKDVGSGTVWWPVESGSRETDEDRSHESL